MKLNFILLSFIFVLFSAAGLSQGTRLSLNLQNASFEEFKIAVEEQTTYRFIYLNETTKGKSISVRAVNLLLEDVLDKSLSQVNLQYEIILNRLIVITPIEDNIKQEGVQIKGTVTDRNTGKPLPGVNIVVKGKNRGTITDLNGKYEILVDDADSDILVYSFVGYISVESPVHDKISLDILLKEDILGLEEVIVVGYGVQKKSDITGSVTSIRLDDLQTYAFVNVFDALQGQIAGLDIITTSNIPGEQQDLLVRGTNSLTASNSPLIILDGIPYNGNFSDINANDIASIELLKDASSAAIYGSRASNGVILINSRLGKSKKPTIQANTRVGFQNPDDRTVPVMSTEKYIEKTRQIAAYELGDPDRWQELLFPSLIDNYNQGISTNWVDDMLVKNALQMEHNISISGSNERTKYFTSINYYDEQGIFYNAKINRISFRVNLDFDITEWFKAGTRTMLSQIDNSGFAARYTDARKLSPYANYYEQDNETLAMFPYGQALLSTGHPKAYAFYDTNDDIRYQLFSNLYFEISAPFLEGLSYKLNFGLSRAPHIIGQYRSRLARLGSFSSGIAVSDNSMSKDWTMENLINYRKASGKHNLFFTGLYSREYGMNESSKIEGRGFPNDLLLYHAMQTAEDLSAATSFSENSLVSYMARLNYNFNSTYLLTLTFRRDGYSGFGKDKKWGNFPSLALGWNIADEAFMSTVDKISKLKIRTSLGINGNQAIGPYASYATLGSRPYTFGDGGITFPGVYPDKMATPNLGWESTSTFNFGVDFGLFRNRMSGSVEYYSSHTSDLLLNRTIPNTTGFSSVLQNIGETKNQGIEVEISTVNINTTSFSWRSNFNIFSNRNEILKLYGGKDTDDLSNLWFIGEAVNVAFDYVIEGLWQEGEDIASSAQPDAEPGFIKLRDLNADNTINNADRKILGRQDPDFVAGLVNNFQFGNFDLSVVLYGRFGGLKQNTVYSYYDFFRLEGYDKQSWHNYNFYDIDYYTKDNPDAEFPALYQPGDFSYAQKWENPSFLRIREITLRYSFPESILDKLPLEKLSVYASVKNLFTFTTFTIGDPELRRNDDYPMTRLLSLGLNLEF